MWNLWYFRLTLTGLRMEEKGAIMRFPSLFLISPAIFSFCVSLWLDLSFSLREMQSHPTENGFFYPGKKYIRSVGETERESKFNALRCSLSENISRQTPKKESFFFSLGNINMAYHAMCVQKEDAFLVVVSSSSFRLFLGVQCPLKM